MGIRSFFANMDNRNALKKIEVIANKVEALSEKFEAMTDAELKEMTPKLKARLAAYETLDDILPEAFATVREASKRVLSMRHFHVQLIGGIALHQGRIAEMRTGEGKTLVSTLPAYLNALSGEGVHIVTVNEYLARRDAEWMGKVHKFLGLTVGVAVSGMEPEAKREAYNSDITYATNNELGFDYLRDNMVINKEDKVQRALQFAIIDEVDSILIDEARTPLIISGRGSKSSEMYIVANRFAKSLKDDDVDVDEKKKTVHLTEDGVARAEEFFNVENLSDAENTDINHYINNAIRAHYIMKRDSDYIVNKGEVIIVDEFTGRLMIGRRYSEGLHQAIEAKENVKIQNENKTLATITFQNYFRQYKKLSGMTGTAKTEEPEFRGIYKLDVVTIPTNMPMVRKDENDQIYTTIAGKMKAIVEDIAQSYERGQPVLVGTVTVDKSEELSSILKRKKIPHNVLNAKNHEREAEIVAQAGQIKTVTIATNMAGRGTDILLGGNAEYMAKDKMRREEVPEELISDCTNYAAKQTPELIEAKKLYNKYLEEFSKVVEKEKEEVVKAGGLRIIGTERHESRRIDNQLRGRAGRQGDVGSSVFYISLEDDLARLFGGDKMKRIAEWANIDEDTPFAAGMLTRQIENAQKNIEGRNYSIRRHVLEYDNVMNKQREIIYGERNKVLEGENIHEQILSMMHACIDEIVDEYCDPTVDWDEWELEELNADIERKLIPGDTSFVDENRAAKWDIDEIKEQIFTAMMTYYKDKVDAAASIGLDFSEVERNALLRVVDLKWMDHIDAMDALRRGINLRAYGNQDPVIVYKKEGFEMFDEMITSIRRDTVTLLMRVNIEHAPRREEMKVEITGMSGGSETQEVKAKPATAGKVVGRNEPCPCGSGNKYKYCCGK